VLNTLPKEFGLNEYINYEVQFEKSFLDPMKGILKTIGWDYEKRNDLMEFFT
jgi:hypothetical protein